MEKTITTFILGAVLCAGSIHAADNDLVYQTATLKNGTVLYGYIQQNDGLGTLLFQSDSAIVYLENVEADCSDRVVPEGQVVQQWREWAYRNNKWEGTEGSRSLLLSDISVRTVLAKDDNFLNKLKGKQAANVKVLERGVKYKYIEMTPNTYSLTWDDIVAISSERRGKTMLSGIVATYHTKGGTYEGQYAGETATTISLYQANGVIQTLAKKDVQKYSYRALNAKQNIFEQSMLLDVVNVRNSSPVTGIVIEQNYAGGKDSENYILVQQESGVIQSVKMSDIVTISKENNSKYSPKVDVVLAEKEVRINGNPAKSSKLKVKKGVYTLESYDPVALEKGADNLTKVEVQYSAVGIGQNVEVFRLVPLKKTGKSKKPVFFFTDEALGSSVYRPIEISTSVNETTTAVYNLNGGGAFVLYDAKNGVAHGVYVKP